MHLNSKLRCKNKLVDSEPHGCSKKKNSESLPNDKKNHYFIEKNETMHQYHLNWFYLLAVSLYIKYCLFAPGRATLSSTSESRLLYEWHVSPLTELIVSFNNFVRSELCVSEMVLYTDWSAIMIGPFQSGPFQINPTLLLNTMFVANFQSLSLPLHHHRFWFLQISTN